MNEIIRLYERGTAVTAAAAAAAEVVGGGPRRTVAFKLAYIGTDKPLYSNCIVLYARKREYLYLVCSFKRTAATETEYARRRQWIYLAK